MGGMLHTLRASDAEAGGERGARCSGQAGMQAACTVHCACGGHAGCCYLIERVMAMCLVHVPQGVHDELYRGSGLQHGQLSPPGITSPMPASPSAAAGAYAAQPPHPQYHPQQPAMQLASSASPHASPPLGGLLRDAGVMPVYSPLPLIRESGVFMPVRAREGRGKRAGMPTCHGSAFPLLMHLANAGREVLIQQ